MRIINIRMSPGIFKMMFKEKSVFDMTWEEYIEWLFNGREAGK